MAEFLPITRRKSGNVAQGQALELSFTPANVGPISVLARAPWASVFPIDPTARTLALRPPGSASPVKTTSDEGFAISTMLVHAMTAAQHNPGAAWKAQVVNRENSAEDFTLTVSYPGTVEVRTLTLPAGLVDGFLNSFLGRMNIHLDHGSNASFIEFPPEFNVGRSSFTIPSLQVKIDLPWPIPDVTINARVNDINSRSITSSLRNPTAGMANGSIRFVITFEESGREIVGTFAANISGMKLTVDLPLTVRNRRISYIATSVATDFQAKVNIVNAPDFVLDPIIGYSSRLRSAVEQRLKALLSRAATRNAFENGIASAIASQLPGGSTQIHSVRVSGGNLIVRHTS